MKQKVFLAILEHIKRKRTPFWITVSGNSMFPILHDNEKIRVLPMEEYSIGEIIVFLYKNEIVLVHRLLKIVDGKYFCKGDNAFRLEDVEKEQIIGKVIAVERDDNSQLAIPLCADKFVQMSLEINDQFTQYGYDIVKTKETTIYKEYEKVYLTP